MVMTGQYNVVNCGGNTSLIVNLLDKLYSSLLPVIEDANSTEPSPAYTAFFKDPSYAPFVTVRVGALAQGGAVAAGGGAPRPWGRCRWS